MESTTSQTDNVQQLIEQHLGTVGVIQDANFKTTGNLKQTQAERRKELVSDVEYKYSLALRKGDHYLGQADVKFYLEKLPANDTDIFLNSHALAVAYLRVNGHHLTDPTYFDHQVIALHVQHLQVGWNQVTLRYLTPYNTIRVGLHSFIDQQDKK